MTGKTVKYIRILLIIVLAVSLGGILKKQLDYKKGNDNYEAAKEIAKIEVSKPVVDEVEVVEKDEIMLSLEEMDLKALQDENSDVLGWILIPDTNISYPVVQNDDNDYYLSHTWNKEKSSVGAIFMDYRNSSDYSDYNTILYGHRMYNDTMFAELKYYSKEDFWKEHPYVYILDEAGAKKYNIFAAYEAYTDAILYRPGLTEVSDKYEFAKTAEDLAVYDTGITIGSEDNILTLVTCTGQGYATRWIVQAVLAE